MKIGLLPLYLKLYDDNAPAARPRLEDFYATVAARLEMAGDEVIRPPFCRLAEEFSATVTSLEAAGAEVLMTLHMAYSPSLECIDALAATRLPIVVLDVTETKEFGPDASPTEIMYNHGIHGVMDMCHMLRRREIPFAIAAGHISSDAPERALGLARAALAAHSLAGTRTLIFGEPFSGMGDFLIPDEEMRSRFGVTVVRPSFDSVASTAESITEEETEEELACDRETYRAQEDFDPREYREMKRICDEGSLGKILYAEGEYNHPANPKDTTFRKQFNYFAEHWRNYLPRTYYITHSLGPIMRATGATPRRVTAFGAYAPWGESDPLATHVGDRAAIITTQNDDGSIFRVTGCAAFGAHHNTYRICGTNGQIENLRGMGDKVMLRYNDWQIPEGREEINCYIPDWNDKDEEIIKTSGHGGSDYLTARMFVECVREGKQPDHPFDLYSAVTMSSVAILAHRSLLERGVPYDIPDFRKAEDAAAYENDFLTPFPDAVHEGDEKLPTCSHPDYAPTERQLALYEETLK